VPQYGQIRLLVALQWGGSPGSAPGQQTSVQGWQAPLQGSGVSQLKFSLTQSLPHSFLTELWHLPSSPQYCVQVAQPWPPFSSLQLLGQP
jgi:hypothetical protein